MASFSNWSENGVLNLLLNGTAFPPDLSQHDVHLGLFTSAAGLEENTSALFQEVTDAAAYRRVRLADAGGFTVSTDGSSHNAQSLDFPTALTDWGLITHTALLDNSVTGSGNVILWAPLANARPVYAGDTMRVREGGFVITLS